MEKEYTKDDLRADAFAILRDRVREIFQKQSANIKFDRIALSSLNYQLALALSRSLSDENEAKLICMIEARQKNEDLLQFYQNELRKQQQMSEEQIKAAHGDNMRMKNEFDKLENTLKNAKIRKSKKQAKLQKEVCATSEVIQNTARFIKNHNDEMKSVAKIDLNYVKNAFEQCNEKKIELLENTKAACIRFCDKRIKEINENTPKKYKIEEMEKRNEQKAKKLREMESKYSKVISAVNSELELNLPTQFANENSPVVRNEIQRAMKRKISDEIGKVREEIEREMPEIVLDGNNWQEAINKYIMENIRTKELECMKILKRSSLREKKLKEKLSDVFNDLSKLKGGRMNQSRILSEMSSARDDWNSNQAKLDEKMAKLNEKMISSTNNSITLPF